jgi:hypothetical protein
MSQENEQHTAYPAALRLGGACVIVGSFAVSGFRLAHGDLPAADAEAALRFITERRMYAGVHLGTILGVLAWVSGFIALSGTLRYGFARVLGRLGAASMLFGLALRSEPYPAWLAWTGVAVGAVTIVAATALFLQSDLFPGALLYGLMVSIVVQSWSLVVGILMWRRGVAGAAT